MVNYYKILDIPENASEAEIKTQFRRLAIKYHPDIDKSNSSNEFILIREAYENLINASKRKIHNDKLYKYRNPRINSEIDLSDLNEIKKESLASKILSIAIFLIVIFSIFYLGAKLDKVSKKIITNEEFNKYANLCTNSIKTKAEIRGSYKHIVETYGNRNNRYTSKKNEFNYDFIINEKTYSFTNTYLATESQLNYKDVKEIIDVWYDKDTPSINSTIDPCITFEDYKKNKIPLFLSSSTVSSISTILIVVGIFLILIFFRVVYDLYLKK